MTVVQQQKNGKVDKKLGINDESGRWRNSRVYLALSFHRGNVRDFELVGIRPERRRSRHISRRLSRSSCVTCVSDPYLWKVF